MIAQTPPDTACMAEIRLLTNGVTPLHIQSANVPFVRVSKGVIRMEIPGTRTITLKLETEGSCQTVKTVTLNCGAIVEISTTCWANEPQRFDCLLPAKKVSKKLAIAN